MNGPVSIELTIEQRTKLATLAEQTGKTWGEVLDDALNAYHPHGTTPNGAAQDTFFDIASRFGLIGCIKGTPSDLSTNPAYMEGFGQRDG